LFCTVDEDVGSGGVAADEKPFGSGFEVKLLIEGLAGLQLESGLHGRVAVLRDLETVASGGEVVEAAGSLTIGELAAGGAEKSGGGADDIGDDVDCAFIGSWNGMSAIVTLFGGCNRRVVILNVVEDADVGRRIAQEFEEGSMLGRMQLAGENESACSGTDFDAAGEILVGDGVFNLLFIVCSSGRNGWFCFLRGGRWDDGLFRRRHCRRCCVCGWISGAIDG